MRGAISQHADQVVGIAAIDQSRGGLRAGRVDAERSRLAEAAAGKQFKATGAGANHAEEGAVQGGTIGRIVEGQIATATERANRLQRALVGGGEVGSCRQSQRCRLRPPRQHGGPGQCTAGCLREG